MTGGKGRKSENIFTVYVTVKALGKNASVKNIARVLGTSTRTIQRYIRILIENGYVEPVRKGNRVYYRVIKPLTEKEAFELVNKEKQLVEAPVYELANRITHLIEEGYFRADLVGAAKIHSIVPEHERITHDVDVVVAPEHATQLITLMKYALGLLPEKRGGPHADYKLRHPEKEIRVDVIIDCFKEEGRPVWCLAKYLRAEGVLSLEHAILAKLTRRSFREEDAYDVVVSLPYIDAKRLGELYAEMVEESPFLSVRVREHLRKVEEYIRREYGRKEAEVRIKMLREIEKVLK